MIKKITAVALAFTMTVSSAYASILGSTLVDNSSLLIANETVLHKNTFLSDQNGVGLQNEYYAEYKPNDKIRPVVITGESIWGKRNITQAIEYMKDNGMYPMIGINASFFSLQTGVPMGHVITNGEITSKDSTELDAVGFYEDGNGFISRLGIKTTAYFDEYEFDIAHINKYFQPETTVMTLFTDEFGATTKATSHTVNVILGSIEGTLSIGKTLSATVEDIKTSLGEVEIPEGKIVLTLNVSGGDAWITRLLEILEVGETITIHSEATVDSERWNKAYNGLGSEGKKILSDGNVASGLEAGAAPRTAVGVKADGTIVFYVIDGRQNGYSYGARQDTLAKRMKELGCIDALNLDGGGSTTISGVYPGQSAASIINSPSDGSLRKVTNFIFLQNMNKPTGKLGGLYLYPYSTHYLSGASVQLQAGAVDSEFHFMHTPVVTYSMENTMGKITDDGYLTLSGTGEAVVNVQSGDVRGSASYFTYESPTDIQIYNKETEARITSLNEVEKNSVIKFEAQSYYGQKRLESSNNLYKWAVDKEIGTINNGILTVTGKGGRTGNVTVTAGETSVNIPVTIAGPYEEPEEVPEEKPEEKPEQQPEDNAELYPYSELKITDDRIRVDMFSYDKSIDFSGSFVRVDGVDMSNTESAIKYEADARHAVIIIPVDNEFKNGYHKIKVQTKTVDGYGAIDNYTVKRSAPQNTFDDCKDHWAKDVIAYMNRQGIINGSSENGKSVYKPDNGMTRTEFAVMMCNFYEANPDDYKNVKLNFKDASKIPSWALNYVKCAVSFGIISGKQNGNDVYFAPDDKITRAEAATVIGRTLSGNFRQGRLAFSDAGSIPSWARPHMAVLTNANVLSGYPDGTICPDKYVTRAEAVAMLFNIY